MEHVVTIKKLIAGGKGLATLPDGLKVMVPGVLPGESVQIVETKRCRGYIEAGLIRVLEASAERVTPPCPFADRCGGCDMQHAAYPAQLAIKEQIIAEALQRAHLEAPGLEPAMPSPSVWGYRYRLRLHLDGEGRLGFHQSGSNQVVAISRCLLATEAINRVIGQLVEAGWPERLKEQAAALELIQCPASGRVVLILEPRDRQPASQDTHRLQAGLLSLVDDVLIKQRNPGARQTSPAPQATLAQDFLLPGHAYRLEWDTSCFFQVNVQQNHNLIQAALQPLAEANQPFRALDLFCGMGNFSIPLGLIGADITGVEHNQHSIHWAQRNSDQAGLKTARFLADDVERRLHRLVRRNRQFDCVLLDPPRQGLGLAAALIPLLKPRLIISVSCDPATLARDLALITKGGYRLTRVIPVDMFPHTHHIESLTFLERN